MNDETIKKLAEALGIDYKQLYGSAFYDFIAKASSELTESTMFVKKYEVMVPENAARFEASVRAFLLEVREIIKDESDLARLRDAY